MEKTPTSYLRKAIPCCLLFGLLFSSTQAQLSFSCASTTSTYSHISTTNQVFGGGIDDNISAATNIGFNFQYGSNVYTQFRVSSNGWISLGNSTLSSLNGNNLATTNNGPILAPLWDDLKTNGSSGGVYYELSGTGSSRVLTIEWLNMQWDKSASNATISFEVKLYEGTGVIEFTYNSEGGSTSKTGSSGGASIGLNGGLLATDLYSLSNSGSGPAVNYGTETNNISAMPSSGRVYRWTPASMTFVSSTCAQGPITPTSKCNNLNQAIINIQVVTKGSANPLSVTQLQITQAGSTALGSTDVSKIHLYYTGTSAGFAPINEFVSGGITPATTTITVTGAQALQAGINYFWIAYDLNTNAVAGDVLDARCYQLTVGGSSKAPTVSSPAGTRTITNCTPGPGGITNASFWVKGDSGITSPTNTGTVSTWRDQSGNSRDATGSGSNRPTWRNNSADNLNFNPVVLFNANGQAAASASFMQIPGNGILSTDNNPYEVYAVIRPGTGNNSSPGKFLFAGTGLSGYNAFDIRSGGTFNDSWDVNDLAVTGRWTAGYSRLVSFDFNAIQRSIFVSGGLVGTKVGNIRWSVDDYNALGCQFSNSPHIEFFDGSIAEIVTYANTSHDQTARNKVESYLALKYGITLTHDYVGSSGATVWSRSNNASYNNNIIGLGRDDIGSLLQKQAVSTEQTADMLTMYIGSVKQTRQADNTGTFAGGDKSWFMAGNNADGYMFSVNGTTDVPSGICCRLRRNWLSQQTNFTNGDLTLEFDFNAAGSPTTPLFAPDLRLLIDNDGTFANATALKSPNVTITVSSQVVKVVVPASTVASMIALPYFTLGSAAINTPLGISIDHFAAACTGQKVTIDWSVTDNGDDVSFSVERSADGRTYSPVGTVAGRLNERSYSWTDAAPLNGVGLYRVKVKENSSDAVVYSTIASVGNCGVGGNNALVATDAMTGRASMVVLQLGAASAVDIALYDVVGHRLDMMGVTGRRNMGPGLSQLSVSRGSLAPGVYLMVITVNDNRQVYRVML